MYSDNKNKPSIYPKVGLHIIGNWKQKLITFELLCYIMEL